MFCVATDTQSTDGLFLSNFQKNFTILVIRRCNNWVSEKTIIKEDKIGIQHVHPSNKTRLEFYMYYLHS